MPSTGFLVSLTVISLVATCAGGLWAVNPKLFVQVWRKIARGDYSIRDPEWEAATTSYSGRLAGCVILCFGLGGFYLLARILHLIS